MKTKRLEMMIDLLEEIRERSKNNKFKFDLDGWAEVVVDYKKDKPELEVCRTSACACGHAALDPRFTKLGLKMEIEGPTDKTICYDKTTVTTVEKFNKYIEKNVDNMGDTFFTIKYKQYEGMTAASKFFDISYEDAEILFNPMEYPQDKVAPSHVIQRIKHLLKNGNLDKYKL